MIALRMSQQISSQIDSILFPRFWKFHSEKNPFYSFTISYFLSLDADRGSKLIIFDKSIATTECIIFERSIFPTPCKSLYTYVIPTLMYVCNPFTIRSFHSILFILHDFSTVGHECLLETRASTSPHRVYPSLRRLFVQPPPSPSG